MSGASQLAILSPYPLSGIVGRTQSSLGRLVHRPVGGLSSRCDVLAGTDPYCPVSCASYPERDAGSKFLSSRYTPPRSAAPILRPASSAYSPSFSAPTKKRPSSLEATPIVPDPQNGSKMRSPSLLEATIARRRRRRGCWVGWYP